MKVREVEETPRELLRQLRVKVHFHAYLGVNRRGKTCSEIVADATASALEGKDLLNLAYGGEWAEMLEAELGETLNLGVHEAGFATAWEEGRSVRQKWDEIHENWRPRLSSTSS